MESKIKNCSKELHVLYEERHKLSRIYDDAMESGGDFDRLELLHKEQNSLDERINSLIENEYASAVYDKYNAEKPVLIRIKTGEEIPWDEAFGKDFANISKSLRHSLVGLVEEPGRYKLKK